MVARAINSQPDLNFSNDWLNKVREYNQILTKPRERELLLQRIKDLEAGKGKKFKELEDKLKEVKKIVQELDNFFTNECAFTSYDNARNLLNGKTVQEVINESRDKDQLITDLQIKNNQLNQEKTDLIAQANNLLNQKENEKQAIKDSFITNKAVGATHWIYWKNWAEKEANKAQENNVGLKVTNNKLIQDYHQLDKKYKDLQKAEVNFLKKVGYDTYPNLEKGVKELKAYKEKEEKDKKDYLISYEVNNFTELDNKITTLNNNLTKQTNKITSYQQKENQTQQAINKIVELVKPRAVLFIGKKKLKIELQKIKGIFKWDGLDTEGISEDEE